MNQPAPQGVRDVTVAAILPAAQTASALAHCLDYLDLAVPGDVAFQVIRFADVDEYRRAETAHTSQFDVLLLSEPDQLESLMPEFSIVVVTDQPIGGVIELHPFDLAPRRLGEVLLNAARHQDVNRQLQYMEHRDPSTALPNVEAFTAFVEQAITINPADAFVFAVAVDAYDELVTSLGSSSSTALLNELANRIKGLMPVDAITARGGEATFFVLAQEVSAATAIAQSLAGSAKDRFILPGAEAYVTVSVGYCGLPTDGGSNAEKVLEQARSACLHALQNGAGSVLSYAEYLQSDPGQRSQRIRLALPHAISNNQFSLHYQPQVDLLSGAISGAEALLRWNGESIGSVSPDQFIPIAEASGVIAPIGRWVLQNACRQAQDWLERYWTTVRLSINLSARQLFDEEFPELVEQLLADSALHPRQLELEIPERELLSLLGGETPAPLRSLHAIRDLGINIAIDDFGVANAPAAYLKNLPVDVLKLDMSLIHNITVDPATAALVKAMIEMGRRLGLRVVAEGVETAAQLEFLKRSGCDEAQGFYLAHPMPAEELIVMVHEHPGGEVDLQSELSDY